MSAAARLQLATSLYSLQHNSTEVLRKRDNAKCEGCASPVRHTFKWHVHVHEQEIIVGRPRDGGDRVTWLLEHARYEQALDIIESDATLTQATREQVSDLCITFRWHAAKPAFGLPSPMHCWICCSLLPVALPAVSAANAQTTARATGTPHRAPGSLSGVHDHKACMCVCMAAGMASLFRVDMVCVVYMVCYVGGRAVLGVPEGSGTLSRSCLPNASPPQGALATSRMPWVQFGVTGIATL